MQYIVLDHVHITKGIYASFGLSRGRAIKTIGDRVGLLKEAKHPTASGTSAGLFHEA